MASELIRFKRGAMTVLPLYGNLSPERQREVFASTSGRKWVAATNIAETSLTIDGIVYVIDCGLANDMMFSPQLRANVLQRTAISQASANQRKGRAGRTRPGVCYRLYTQDMFTSLQPSTVPAILRADMRTAILQVQTCGFHDVWSFDWLDKPAPEALLRAISDLKWMGFLDKNAKITGQGKQAAKCPVDPAWFYTILQGMKFGCAQETISLAALSSTQGSIFLRPHSHRYAADLIGRPNFGHPVSDHLALLNAYHAWCRVDNAHENHVTAIWSERHGLSNKTLREAAKIHEQLGGNLQYLLQGKFPAAKFDDPEYATNIRKALAAGLFLNSAIRVKGEDTYKTAQRHNGLISPESALVGGQHELVVCSTLAMSNRLYLVTCTRIEPEWIADMPYFAEENVLKDAHGQPKVAIMQESLARARGRIEAEKRRDVGAEKPQ
ncbi:hypothetical protein PFICI_13651 [Pestalotiopsis fici W106-1]|uniref:Helicase C-terminal domain-containing protein n=1 Tax=Pestalotiopsis fici (strain W106-1 / CGMCC3.15140) TaxID=1229662 RepID=W3WPU1_PESFW|nr:uncharacterized protein PFICI_13651 [Pestalotiopsis fici W106-1]ETS75167.1 hypothetical protein PFICI_13651 [Pestalotiopsis fici W106-1]